MARLGRVIVEAITHEYGRDEVLRRLAHPFWFQSFGAVMGMDWHSSGITTSVVGALKRGLKPIEGELGLRVCGGRGSHSRKTPAELIGFGERTGVDGEALARTSRLVAKVDSAAVQDGFDIYLHGFIVTDDGKWTVVQQGMNTDSRQARRYHWLSEEISSFVDEPHANIDGVGQGQIVNMTDRRAAPARDAQIEVLSGGPEAALELVRKAAAKPRPHLVMPAHHDVRPTDVLMRRLRGTLAAASDAAPTEFTDLLLTPGVGARTVAALALVGEVLYGAPCRFTDPARFSMAHGGKDGHPFPVPIDVFDQTIGVLRSAVDNARLGNDDRLAAVRRLDRQARALERVAVDPTFDAFVQEERTRSPEYGGRTVFGPAGKPERKPKRRPNPQLGLFEDS